MAKNLIPEISIAIPTYEMNGVGDVYLKELFETIKCQSFKNFEVCVSDHSTGESILNLCEIYANFFEIRYFKNKSSKGNGPSNTNSSVEMCSGKIVKLMFQDDLFLNSAVLETINSVYTKHNCKWTFNSFAHTDDGKKIYNIMEPRWTDKLLEGRNLLGSPSSVSFLLNEFVSFDENLRLLMDTEFYHRMRCKLGLPFVIKDVLTINREHPNRISSSQINYDKFIEHEEGGWLVNSDELEYVLLKNKSFTRYPDEN